MSEPITVDVQQIMAEIRQEIEEKHLRDDLPEFAEVSLPEGAVPMEERPVSMENLNEFAMKMNEYYAITGAELEKGSPLKQFLKKVIARFVGFFVRPGFEQATCFNASATQAVNQLVGIVQAQQKTIDALERRVAELEAKNKEA